MEQNVTEAFGFSEKYCQNLWWLNFRILDYRSVESEEREFSFILELDSRLNATLTAEEDNIVSLILLYMGI